MNQASDPLDAFARLLVHLFGRQVSPTIVLDIFAGLCVIGIAIAFIHGFKNLSKNGNDDDESP
jgi:hypothetical protein